MRFWTVLCSPRASVQKLSKRGEGTQTAGFAKQSNQTIKSFVKSSRISPEKYKKIYMKYSTDKEKRQKLLREKIAKFCLFDDDFMSKVFEDGKEATEYRVRDLEKP